MNRGSICNAFGDKRALYLEALELFGQQHNGQAAQLVDEFENIQDAVSSVYDSAFKGMKGDKVRWGCFMCNAAVEVPPVDEEVAAIVKKYMGMLSKALFISMLASSQNRHDVVYLKNMAEQLTASYIGFNVMARTTMPATSLRRVADSAVEMSKMAL